MTSEEQSEEQNREPDSRRDRDRRAGESPDPVEEARGSLEDPASLDQPGEDSGAVEGREDISDLDGPLLEEESGIGEEESGIPAEELEATRRERDEYLEALRRLKAEFENSRKRQEREKARLLQTASERLVLELLPVLDNLERALEAGGDLREGVRATRDQLADVLNKEGLLPVASDGQPFDPTVHEAVMSQPSDEHEEGTVLQTFQRGYLLNGKSIRPAQVVVAKQV